MAKSSSIYGVHPALRDRRTRRHRRRGEALAEGRLRPRRL